MDEHNQLHLPLPDTEADYVYTGVQILSSAVFHKSTLWPHQTFFSLTKIFAEAEHRKRLFGYVHDDLWADIGNPQGLEEARQKLQLRERS
jgi:MurNAc alpha-1-phosphate uridylyltransferase